jgi:CRISPR system Cascade subunit CasC
MKLVEVHVLQNVVPANLNRDDTGSPKSAVFGGFRRARVSSQSQKRAVRQALSGLLAPDDTAVRTRKLISALTARLVESGKEEPEATLAAQAALEGIGLGVDDDDETEYLLFMGQREIKRLADLILAHWDTLMTLSQSGAEGEGKEKKKKAKAKVPTELKKDFGTVFDGGRAVDLAMFGRMLADRPEWNVDAASQVAHAISTHKVEREFDFYTAVDDLNPKEETGAGMMGDVEFYSATLYRYANVNLEQLLSNLQGDTDLARRGIEAFIRAFVMTLPSGKQNTFAAHNPPDYVAVTVREGDPRNLANAFAKPVWRGKNGVVAVSVTAFDQYWGKVNEAYGDSALRTVHVDLTDSELENSGVRVRNFDEAVREVMQDVATWLEGV